MRPRLGIVLGGAALSGIAAAFLASGQPGPPTAIQLIAPASVTAGGLLGASGHADASPGPAPGCLLVPTLPGLSVPSAPSQQPASPVAVTAPSTGAPAPTHAATPIPAVLASLPLRLPVVDQVLPILPLPISPPPVLNHSGGHHHDGGHRRG